jgi:8-amino-7-oxononanoate synthase
MENHALLEMPSENRQSEQITEKNNRIIEEDFIQKVQNYSTGIAKWKSVHQYFRQIESAIGPTIRVCGQDIVMLASNDYLGLSNHSKVKEETIKAISKYGVGSGSTFVLSGTFDLHNELERELAEFKGTEAALLFATGFMANYGAITTLLDKNYIIINDEKNHISIIEGCRAVRARTRMFRHNDMTSLEKILKLYKNNKKAIIVEGIYSMDGDIANLPVIIQLTKEYNAQLIIDDAHATGVLGENGRGSLDYFNFKDGADVITDSFGKSFGSIGGFISGPRFVIDHIKHLSRHYIFTTSLPPAICASVLAALRIIKSEKGLRSQLWNNIKMLRNGLIDMGFNLGNSQAHIIPVIIGNELKTYEFAKLLQKKGVFVNAVGRPAIPRGAARLRVTPMATHTVTDINRALEAFKKVGKKIGLI